MIEIDLFTLKHNILLAVCLGVVLIIVAELLGNYFDKE